MVESTLGDRPSAVNIPSSAFDFSCANPPQSRLDWVDYMQNNLDKARALVTVAQWGNGLSSCPEGIQHNYLLVVDELLEAVAVGMNKIQIYNHRDD